jgi:hypothetical protein
MVLRGEEGAKSLQSRQIPRLGIERHARAENCACAACSRVSSLVLLFPKPFVLNGTFEASLLSLAMLIFRIEFYGF